MTSTPIRGVKSEGGREATTRGAKGQTKADVRNVVARVPQKQGDGKECQHSKGGGSVVHGPGVKMKYKPVMTVTTGPDGKISRTMKKERYFACDLALSVVGGGRGGKLSQTQLPFKKTTKKSDGTVDNTRQGEVGEQNYSFSLSMCTAGQSTALEEHLGM